MNSSSKRAALDGALAAAGLAFGVGSLAYPFGRDQGLYYYVAREWVLRGSIPYRDVLDHKTPGIYILYALAVRCFGEVMWGIRIIDFIGVLALGWLAALIATPPGEDPPAGLRGASVLTIAILYYGYLDYWNTAQSELWYSMFGLGAVWAARRIERIDRACLAAGAFAGAAMLMKPPAIWLLFVAVVLMAHRIRRNEPNTARIKRLVVASAWFAAGAIAVCGPVLAYLGAHHAIGPMLDIVVGANNYYVQHEVGINSQSEVLDRVVGYFAFYMPLCAALFAMLPVVAITSWRNDRPTAQAAVLAATLLVAGFLGVWMQKKFYLLHWTVFLGPLTVTAACILRWMILRGSRLRAPLTIGIAVMLLLYANPIQAGNGAPMWWSASMVALKRARGRISHQEYSAHYTAAHMGFWFDHSERVGDWLREHTTPEEFVTVRGFQPEIYAVAHRRHSGRFFWTTFITNPLRAYKREQWLAEDLAALREHPPKYVVCLTDVHEGPDAVEYFTPLGYSVVEVLGEYTIMGRPSP